MQVFNEKLLQKTKISDEEFLKISELNKLNTYTNGHRTIKYYCVNGVLYIESIEVNKQPSIRTI